MRRRHQKKKPQIPQEPCSRITRSSKNPASPSEGDEESHGSHSHNESQRESDQTSENPHGNGNTAEDIKTRHHQKEPNPISSLTPKTHLQKDSHKGNQENKQNKENIDIKEFQEEDYIFTSLDMEINNFMASFLQTKSINPHTVKDLKYILISQIEKLISVSVTPFVISKNKNIVIGLPEFLKVIQKLDQKYQSKITRTFVLEEFEKSMKGDFGKFVE